MDKIEDFINTEDTLRALTAPIRFKLEDAKGSQAKGKCRRRPRKASIVEGEMEACIP